ncbi:uncharacterized protein BDR25DRAFT_321365 [Lindgomyces ingoldianus]|uniref:Uncharacterized protein n=1 Tax=Lindgomyces ingoldianus TaxID=673940 RepID=A0ACB6RHU6_9PLEO|nr:uncharacterized protein BDR25DRAFT_321365 [Lindgomyces ingoldianus]KAF2478343.1 hypothetical protein BDR25DRAFT_321365 [Lindgomyces ingoldianus]
MSMFDKQGIPKSLLQYDTNQLDFDDALAPLLSFSLVRVEIGKQSFNMHPLVQVSMRTVLSAVFPSGDYKTWADCDVLLPYAREAISHRASRMSTERKEEVLGLEHLDTLISVSQLGSVLEGQAKYEEAEAMHRRALEGYEKLGREHPDTLTSVSQLGSVLSMQGKDEEAEAMYRRALEGYEKVLRLEHSDTLTSVSQLRSALERQGKSEEAEAMDRRAQEGRKKSLGLEHPDTLTGVS